MIILTIYIYHYTPFSVSKNHLKHQVVASHKLNVLNSWLYVHT